MMQSALSGWTQLALASLFMATVPGLARGADITTGRASCDFDLVGEIQTGVAEKFAQIGIQSGDTLCLNSPGGNFAEAMKIASDIRGFGVTTILPENAECYSACAMVFMAGTEWEAGPWPSRQMHVTANLGFHAPYLVLPDADFNKAAVQKAYRVALQSVADMIEMGAVVVDGRLYEGPGGNPGAIPGRVIWELLKKGPDEFYMVDTPFRARELGIVLFGAPQPVFSEQSLCNVCVNQFEGRVYKDICDRGFVVRSTSDFSDVIFEGVGAEAAGFCGLRVPKDPSSPLRVDPQPIWRPETMTDDNMVDVKPEMALSNLGH